MSKRLIHTSLIALLALLLSAPVFSQNWKEKKAVESALVEVVKQMSNGLNLKKCHESLENMLKFAPDDDALHYYLGICCLKEGKVEQGFKELKEACRLDPSNEDYKDQLAHFEGKDVDNNISEAAFFMSLLDLSTDTDITPAAKCEYLSSVLSKVDPRTYRVWGPQLDTVVLNCVATHPKDTSSLELAGSWFYATGRDKIAEDYFLRLLDVDGKNPSRLSVAGDIYINRGEVRKGYRLYEKALKIDPEYCPVLNNYAYFLCIENRQLSKAEKMSRITVEKEPDNPTYLDTLGWILHLRKKDAEAKPLFKRAIIYGGKKSKTILLHYAEVLESLGEKDTSSYYRSLGENMR